jgi:hypothetical protein
MMEMFKGRIEIYGSKTFSNRMKAIAFYGDSVFEIHESRASSPITHRFTQLFYC